MTLDQRFRGGRNVISLGCEMKMKLIVIVSLGQLVAFSGIATAQYETLGWTPEMIMYPITGAVSLTFLTTDIVYGAQKRWLPRAWAWNQIFFGGLSNLGAAVFYSFLIQGSYSKNEEATAIMCTYYVLSAWFVVHGILSLSLYKPSPSEEEPKKIKENDETIQTIKKIPQIAVSPTDNGAIWHLHWVF